VHPEIPDIQVDERLEREFAMWFSKYVQDPSKNISNQFLKDLAKGPLRSVMSYNGYVVNGYKFHTKSHGSDRATMNSGVCIKGTNYSIDERDYYGQLIEVLRLEYPGLPIKRTVLFKCDWFDPTPNVGTKVHQQYKLIEVNHRRSFNKYEPFVLAVQATQVNYTTYPSLRRDKIHWWAVFKIKARSVVELPAVTVTTSSCDTPFQQDEMEFPSIHVDVDNAQQFLSDPNETLFEIDDEEVEDEDEPQLDSETDDENHEDDIDSE
jgi:hypothetical protein